MSGCGTDPLLGRVFYGHTFHNARMSRQPAAINFSYLITPTFNHDSTEPTDQTLPSTSMKYGCTRNRSLNTLYSRRCFFCDVFTVETTAVPLSPARAAGAPANKACRTSSNLGQKIKPGIRSSRHPHGERQSAISDSVGRPSTLRSSTQQRSPTAFPSLDVTLD
jgi:hypothetical protein